MDSANLPSGSKFDGANHSHRRYNPLTRSWVLCSPHRTKRPWQGAVEPPPPPSLPSYDAACYLCPGNQRAGGATTDQYQSTYVFENDFAALVADDVESPIADPEDGLFALDVARGKCFVICFSPRHDLTVAEMTDLEIGRVVSTWTKLYKEVSNEYPWLKYIQIFENKGSMMGCSNPHPHGQAWSLSYIPSVPATMLSSMKAYASVSPVAAHGLTLVNGRPCLLLDYAQAELRKASVGIEASRVVIQGAHFVVVVPFWASWPFETMVLPYKRHIPSLAHLTPDETEDLAQMIGGISRRMDNLFECSFGYSMGLYQAPVHSPALRPTSDEDWAQYAQLHLGFYPPLLRSSTVKKFLVGFELFAETQRDITPEQACQRLRDAGDTHWKRKGESPS